MNLTGTADVIASPHESSGPVTMQQRGQGPLPYLKIRDLTSTPLVPETIKQIRRTTMRSQVRQTCRLLFLLSFFFFALSSQQLPMTLHAHQGVGTKSRSETSQYAPPKVIGTIKNEDNEKIFDLPNFFRSTTRSAR